MDLFVFISMIIIVSPLLLLLSPAKYKKVTIPSKSDAEDNLESLNRIQTYEFWRNFGKRGEQTQEK